MKPTSTIRKIRRPRANSTFSSYIQKILKQVHPDLIMQRGAMLALNSIMEDAVGRMTRESSAVARCAKKSTLSAKHVEAAVRSLMPGDLSKHAVGEGSKAVARFGTHA